MYFDQQTHACACVHMVENNEKRLKIIKKVLFSSCAQETHVRLMQEHTTSHCINFLFYSFFYSRSWKRPWSATTSTACTNEWPPHTPRTKPRTRKLKSSTKSWQKDSAKNWKSGSSWDSSTLRQKIWKMPGIKVLHLIIQPFRYQSHLCYSTVTCKVLLNRPQRYWIGSNVN